MQPLSLYIHIPWCIKKCPYCDFNSHAAKAGTPERAYVQSLLSDLDAQAKDFAINRPVRSIFIGGGTPSLFSPEALDALLNGIKQSVCLENGAEITLEANPGTFESAKFREFNALGINRLSIGIQSFNDGLLKRLGRVHSGSEAIKAAEIAKEAGFTNFNLDLMFGLPGAVPGDSERDVATAINLNPSHISFYQLTLEPNTLFHKYPPRLPDDEIIFNTQTQCQYLLSEQGYQQYEISAYSQPGKQCHHNLNYWQFGDYLGIGAGAHGKITLELPNRIVRTAKTKSPEGYMNNPVDYSSNQAIPIAELPLEFVMNQLRLRRGFSPAHFKNATGLEETVLEPALSNCVRKDLIAFDQGNYACTQKGWHFLDTVLEAFFDLKL